MLAAKLRIFLYLAHIQLSTTSCWKNCVSTVQLIHPTKAVTDVERASYFGRTHMWSRCPGLQLWATVFVITATASHADRLEHALHPGHSLHRQLLRFGSESVWYSLQHLKPNTGYEVRVSYPATVPSKVTLQLITVNASQAGARHSCQCRRHLLDTEKLIFYTDDKGTYQGQEAVVQMEAEATGIHRDGPAAKPEYFLFNIGLAELVLGIPADAFPVVLMVVIVIMAVLLLLPWWVESAVPAMLRFMAVGRDADHCSHTS